MKSRTIRRGAAALAAAALAAGAPAAAAQEDLVERVYELEQEIVVLQRQLETLMDGNRDTASETPEAPGDRVTMKGPAPTFRSADGNFSMSVTGRVHWDVGFYNESDTDRNLNDGSNLRRARLGVTGSAMKDFGYNIVLDGGDSAADDVDIDTAFVSYKGLKPLALTFGQHKAPLTLEDRTSSNDIPFIERSLGTNLFVGPAGQAAGAERRRSWRHVVGRRRRLRREARQGREHGKRRAVVVCGPDRPSPRFARRPTARISARAAGSCPNRRRSKPTMKAAPDIPERQLPVPRPSGIPRRRQPPHRRQGQAQRELLRRRRRVRFLVFADVGSRGIHAVRVRRDRAVGFDRGEFQRLVSPGRLGAHGRRPPLLHAQGGVERRQAGEPARRRLFGFGRVRAGRALQLRRP